MNRLEEFCLYVISGVIFMVTTLIAYAVIIWMLS